MVSLERTQRDFIRNSIRDIVQNSRVGRVVQVYTHTADDDNSNFEVDVLFPEEQNVEHRGVPVITPHTDTIAVPKVGDKVLVEYLHGDKKHPIVRQKAYTNEERPPKGESGMWRKRLESRQSPVGSGDLYLTAHTRYNKNPAINKYQNLTPEQTFIRLAKKEDAFDEPSDSLPLLFELYDEPQNDKSRIRFEGNAVDGDTGKTMGTTMDFKGGTTTTETTNSSQSEETRVQHDVESGFVKMEGIKSSQTEELRVKHDARNGKLRVEGKKGGDQFQLQIDVRNKTAKFSGDGTNEMGLQLNFGSDAFKILDGNGYGIESDGSGNFTWHHKSIDMKENSTTSL